MFKTGSILTLTVKKVLKSIELWLFLYETLILPVHKTTSYWAIFTMCTTKSVPDFTFDCYFSPGNSCLTLPGVYLLQRQTQCFQLIRFTQEGIMDSTKYEGGKGSACTCTNFHIVSHIMRQKHYRLFLQFTEFFIAMIESCCSCK